MILTTTNQNEKVSNEAVWQKNVFSDEKFDFNISKKFFPGNTLIYTDEGRLHINCKGW